jgi:prepilin-type N-terminal cleavage/methylation domain-containing protein
VRPKQNGLTIIEMLTVVAVIAILIGLLLPATSMVHRLAKDTKQKAQFTAIGLGLEAFKQDLGYYPASNATFTGSGNQAYYTGAQKLAEAMVGRDLMGYNKTSDLATSDGVDAAVTSATNKPYPLPTEVTPIEYQLNLQQRQDRYVELETANAFRVTNENGFGLYTQSEMLSPYTYLLCDEFDKKTVILPDGTKVKAGSPILYYRANPSGQTIRQFDETKLGENTYNLFDNDYLVTDVRAANNELPVNEPFTANSVLADRIQFFYGNGTQNHAYQFGYVQDRQVINYPTSHRPDSYLLISAGHDGLYGTEDDITNFGN